MMTGSLTIVDAASIPWVNGADVYSTMEPAFRDNLGGDEASVLALLSKYWMRSLWLDPDTTRRIDHIRTEPGYIDLGEAYHDSVEEAYFLSGEVELTAEGQFVAGDYFWRPPGWVHMARSKEGFESILMMEGESPTDGSGRVSRVVRELDEAGSNPLAADMDSIGPRGYVRRRETRFMVWHPSSDEVIRLGSDKLLSKYLSTNPTTGACSRVVSPSEACSFTPPPTPRERFMIVTEGSVTVGGRDLEVGSLIHIPVNVPGPTIRMEAEAQLLVKVGAEQ